MGFDRSSLPRDPGPVGVATPQRAGAAPAADAEGRPPPRQLAVGGGGVIVQLVQQVVEVTGCIVVGACACAFVEDKRAVVSDPRRSGRRF